jgi:hypothetical protein
MVLKESKGEIEKEREKERERKRRIGKWQQKTKAN